MFVRGFALMECRADPGGFRRPPSLEHYPVPRVWNPSPPFYEPQPPLKKIMDLPMGLCPEWGFAQHLDEPMAIMDVALP